MHDAIGELCMQLDTPEEEMWDDIGETVEGVTRDD